MDTLNPSHLSLSTTGLKAKPAVKNKSNIPRHRTGEKFLKGPIPLHWISIAMKLPGKSWHVATAIWFLAGLNNSATVKLNQSVLDQLGISRYSKSRALAHLEKAELIVTESRNGKNPIITLLDPAEVI